MELAGHLVNTAVLECRPVAEMAKAHGVSRSRLYELLARHRGPSRLAVDRQPGHIHR